MLLLVIAASIPYFLSRDPCPFHLYGPQSGITHSPCPSFGTCLCFWHNVYLSCFYTPPPIIYCERSNLPRIFEQPSTILAKEIFHPPSI